MKHTLKKMPHAHLLTAIGLVFTGCGLLIAGFIIQPPGEIHNSAPARAPEDAPALVKKIGKTTYKVRVHFSDTSTETMSDKIKRMLKNEIQQM